MAHSGPVYGRLEGAELTLGFRVLAHHVNPLGICHGGMLATFADILLACGAMYRPEAWGRILPTIGLQLDYLAPAPRGAWVEGQAELLRATRSMVFSQCVVRADGTPALRASSTAKLGPAQATGPDWDPLQLW